MKHTYTVSSGPETLTLEGGDFSTRITVTDETGEASINLDGDSVRKLMTLLGALVEPYRGAWGKLEPADDN